MGEAAVAEGVVVEEEEEEGEGAGVPGREEVEEERLRVGVGAGDQVPGAGELRAAICLSQVRMKLLTSSALAR